MTTNTKPSKFLGPTKAELHFQVVETTNTPTAHDTLAEKRKRLEEQLEALDSQEKIADVADLVVSVLNSSENVKLREALKLIETQQIPLMYDEERSEFRYAQHGSRMTTVNQPQASTGSAKRSWFKTVTNPEGVMFEVNMKTPTSMDIPRLSETVGIDMSKDGNGNSTSTVGKMNILKKLGWTFELETNN